MIRAIFYDMGDIFFEAHFWRKWMFEKLVSLNRFPGSFSDFYFYYESFLLPVYEGVKDYKTAYFDFLDSLNINEKESFFEESFKVKKQFEDNRNLYPEVKSTLDKLKLLGIINVVITDNEQSEESIRRNILNRFDISNSIDTIFSSRSYNLTKPNPKIFQLAMDKFSLSSHSVLFVGHDKDEIDGAETIGIRSIEFNNYLGLTTSATYKISHFSELINLAQNE
jgi:HAD superfamily hydrolase (TIGR01549 family)